ncbi:MAG: Gfo/Idh/MocA family oxidoreductase [Pirellulaceae bacterium]|jgi:predicted dehydrogenase|nr:Gfo/Idh/MocA family oxidoreductase [Pirellulaceae bacterium]MDP7018019.1 Gfo/Idh/MocA family oxidoreductase [Pirellulaceae bacterium]
MSHRNNRRDFLQTTALGGVGFFVASGVQAQESKSSLEQINFASVGVGGKGTSDSNDAGRSGNMVAICDIDDNNLGKAAKKWPKAEKFNDYREMFEKVGKSIDAVTVSTPDHNHAPATSLALKAGKACFTQKPMTHSIYEARRLGELARENKCATSMGNQGTANPGLRKAAALVQAGFIGTVKSAHVWTNRPVWPQGLDRPKEEPAVPGHIHWNEFIGPAEFRPYHEAYHPFKWRGWWAFGTGALGDMACHTLNMPFAALDLRDPTSVEAKTSGHNKETYPQWSVIDYAFPERNGRAALTMTWYDGGKLPDEKLFQGEKVSSSGTLLVGEKGTIYSPGDYGGNFKVLEGGEVPKDVEYKRSPGHFKEWVQSIRGGDPAMANFPEYASPLTEVVLLGNLAVFADGKKIEWDAKKLAASNAPDLDWLIKHEYRDGYQL